jgi:3-oxoadipate enol-lactonase
VLPRAGIPTTKVNLMERHELARPDGPVRYWLGGRGDGPVLVFLHGATLDHRSWDAQRIALQSRYRIVVPDLRAHGESMTADAFSFAAAVDDVVALLDDLDLDRIGLIGLSLGGNIAQEIVYRDPARVAALVVADATCNTCPRHAWQAPLTIAALSGLGLLGRDTFLHATATATARDPDVQRYVREVNRTRSSRDTLAILTSMLGAALHPDEAYRLPVPTLLLHGDGDQLGDIAAGTRAWAAREPLAEYAIVPGAQHASNQDNPEAFNAALTAFLDRTLAPSGPVARPFGEWTPGGLYAKVEQRLRRR